MGCGIMGVEVLRFWRSNLKNREGVRDVACKYRPKYTDTFDPRYTGTQNLYLALFGRLPEGDIDPKLMPYLIGVVNELPWADADAVKMRFGLYGGKCVYPQELAAYTAMTEGEIRLYLRRGIARLRFDPRAAMIKAMYAWRG